MVRTTSLTESLIDVGAGGSPAPPSVVEDRVEALLRAVGYATARADPPAASFAAWDLTALGA